MTYRYIPPADIDPDLALREITDSNEDAYQVCIWRNSELATHSFMVHDVTTPDTHRSFVKNRKAHDIVWFVDQLQDNRWVPIGMVSLTVDIRSKSAEAGRLFVSCSARGTWLGKRVINLASHFAFDVLNLRYTWCDIVPTNKPVIWIHRKLGWEQVTSDSLGIAWSLRRDDMIFFKLTKEVWDERHKNDSSV